MRASSHLSLAQSPALAATDQNEHDRRSNIRHTLSELPWLSSARVKYGPAVAVLDLSHCGAQIETEAFRLQPGSSVVLEITGEGPGITIPAQVLRCEMAGISPQPIYRGGLVFKSTIDFPGRATRREELRATDGNPLNEHARLSVALQRLSNATLSGIAKRSGLVTSVDADALAAALSMMSTPEAKRAGSHFARELSRLFRTVTDGLQQHATPEAQLRSIADQLRRVVPAKTIRLVEGTPSVLAAMTASMCLDVPSNNETKGARLLIDVAAGSSVAEWHFQYLKAAAHLISVVRKLGPPADQVQAGEKRATPPSNLPSGWHRVVVRYTDGRLLKGFSREFTVLSTVLHVWPSPNAALSTRVAVPLHHLKAVFFVRDFDGDPDHVDDGTAGEGHGRRIAITFLDGETLTGTTLNYSRDAAGFFVRPADSAGNNVRIFVSSRAIRHVHFPTVNVPDRVSSRRPESSPKTLAV